MNFNRTTRIARIAGAVIALCGADAQAGERELEGDAAPKSAREIKNPIERVFPEKRERRPLIAYVRERMKKLPTFLADSEIEAKYRTYYLHQDDTTDTTSEAWAMGGSLAVRSGRLADVFSVELEGFTSQPVVADDDRGGTLLLEPVQDGYTVLGIANGKLEYGGIVLTGYRQYLDLPYLNGHDNRMTPNTFESITLAKPKGDLRFSTGYTWRIKNRNSDEFETMTESLGLDRDRGFAHAGMFWDPDSDFDLGFVFGALPDVQAGLYAETGYTTNATEKIELRLDGQFTYDDSIGDNLLGDQLGESWNIGFRGSASYEGAVARLGFSLTGDNPGPAALFGSNPSYVDLMQRTFTREDEKALLVSASYDFGRIGIDGLQVIMNFAAGFDGESSEGDRLNAQEVDLTIDFRIRDGFFEHFWLRLRGSYLHDEGGDEDGTDLRFILRYDFPVI